MTQRLKSNLPSRTNLQRSRRRKTMINLNRMNPIMRATRKSKMMVAFVIM